MERPNCRFQAMPKIRERQRSRSGRRSDRHPPTFRDRPLDAVVNIVVISLVGGLIAYGCTAILLP